MAVKLFRLWLLQAAAAFSFAVLANAQQYSLGPDSQPQPGVPKGSLTKYVLPPGRFYPGTPHNYSVYLPAQYDPAKPTPFMIFLDGSAFAGDSVRVPVVFDNLIAKHELPPMIGIFVDPGVLPAFSENDQNRYERIFEYDSLSDRYSSFLLDELIPNAAKQYNLSSDPDDRALCGLSTGAVGAFVAAWNRPDQFHRVLSFIGTYVAMKGADSLPALVRKTEPKPIRIFLQDGKNDHIVPAEPYGTFFAGSWPINNQVMYQALEYSGYDATLIMGEGGHDMKQGGAIMPDALRWLWRDYPNPIVVHEPAAMHQPGWEPRGKVFSTISLDQPWHEIGHDYGPFQELAADRDGNVYISDLAAGRIFRADPQGAVTLWKEHLHAKAMHAGPDNWLYVSDGQQRRILALDSKGQQRKIANDVDVDDLTVSAKGAIYYLDAKGKKVGLITPDGKSRTVFEAASLIAPSGLALSPDQAMLVITDRGSRFSWSLQISPDGSLVNGEPFYRLEMPESGPTTGALKAAEDTEGQVYFVTPLGIQMCEANGRLAEILNPPEIGVISDFAFAGKNPTWLYVIEKGKLFRRQVKVTGAETWAPVKPPKPPL